MALIVEDGTGLANAEAYTLISFLDDYFARYFPAFKITWDALSDATQELHARTGAKYVDDRYRGRWKGERTFRAQGMAWPRCGVEDEDCYCLLPNEMPTRLLQATAEAVKRSAAGENLQPDPGLDRDIKSESKELDVLKKSVTYVGSKPTQPLYVVIDRLLMGYVETGTYAERA